MGFGFFFFVGSVFIGFVGVFRCFIFEFYGSLVRY